MHQGDKTLLLVGSMIEMSHNLGHAIIAEGVEITEQHTLLKNLGCETAQGYLFSKPITAHEIVQLLNNKLVT